LPIQRRTPPPEAAETDIAAALRRAIRGRRDSLDAHLRVLERDLAVEGTHTALHAYFLPLDGNGRVRFKPLAEFLRDRIVDIRECLESLAPFLVEPEGADAKRSQDILLVNEFANFTDERLVEGLRRALNTDHPTSLTTRHCGFALVAFDCDSYSCELEPSLEQIERSLREELANWSTSVSRRVHHEKLHSFDVHFICVPMPSAAEFRSYFLELLGVRA
jgi:hypothetical protein